MILLDCTGCSAPQSARPVSSPAPKAWKSPSSPKPFRQGRGRELMAGTEAVAAPIMRGWRVVCLSVLFSIWALSLTAAAVTQLTFNTQDFAPFNYEVNGVVSGPAADVIRKVCAEMKIDCPMTLLPWRRAQQEVEEGKINGMFVIGWNAERAKSLYFSPPLLETEYGFFVRDDNPLKFRQNADVKG